MKGLIVYESRGGSTAEYAAWLAEDTGFEIRPASQVRNLKPYDIVVVGSCIRAHSPSIASWMKRHRTILNDRHLVLFTVAGAPKNSPERQSYVSKAFQPEQWPKMVHFPLNGRMQFDKMRWMDRKLMQFAIKMTAKKNPEEAKNMGREFDMVKRQDLAPVLAHVRKLIV